MYVGHGFVGGGRGRQANGCVLRLTGPAGRSPCWQQAFRAHLGSKPQRAAVVGSDGGGGLRRRSPWSLKQQNPPRKCFDQSEESRRLQLTFNEKNNGFSEK